MLGRGLVNTFYLAVAAIIIGTLAGILICIARLYGPKPVRLLAVGFIDIFRALPILVVLIVIYYALPFVGIRLNSFTSATIALSIVLAAFTAEVFRAGIKAIPVGQFEAARALGLPFYVTLLKVILPQAIRIATPPQTSQLHLDRQGHVARLGRRDARPPEAGDRRAGDDGQSEPADRRGGDLPDHPLAAGAAGRVSRAPERLTEGGAQPWSRFKLELSARL